MDDCVNASTQGLEEYTKKAWERETEKERDTERQRELQ